MNLRKYFLAFLALVCDPGVADTLCLSRQMVDDKSGLGISEARFTALQYQQSLRYLRERIPALIRQTHALEALRDSEYYYIGYPNHLSFIEGYVLKQEVLLRDVKRELVAERQSRGMATREDLERANQSLESAKDAFCSFVWQSRLVD